MVLYLLSYFVPAILRTCEYYDCDIGNICDVIKME